MKKLIYSLAIIALGLVGCTSFDDAVTEKYGEGPAIAINITSTTDSAFTFTLTPGAGTQYYNFIIDQNDEAEELDASALLQGQYGNSENVCKAEETPSLTLTIDAEPNTTYQIYAVAASDKGIVGQVAVTAVTTTDNNAPALVKNAFEPVSDKKAVVVTFNQDILRGTGAVTGVYYKEWDWENPVTIDPADIVVEIDGNEAAISAPTTPDGAILTFSWEGGAFVDAKGNKCGALTTVYDENEDDFIGAVVQNKKVAFDIADSYVTAPADGALIGKVEDFKGEITFPFNIYRIDELVEDGDLEMTYTNAKRSVSYKLSGDQWSVKDNVLSFVLPATPEGGDILTVSVAEFAINDVYGNPNNAFTSETSWKFFAPTKDMVLGNFDYLATIGAKTYNLGTFSIIENAEAENGLILKDFYLEGSQVPATLSLADGKLFVSHLAYVGIEEDEEEDGTKTPYAIYTYDASGNKNAPVTINADGTLTTDALILVGTPDNEHLYYWVNASETVFQRPAAAARGAKAGKHFSKKGKKLNVKLSDLRR